MMLTVELGTWDVIVMGIIIIAELNRYLSPWLFGSSAILLALLLQPSLIPYLSLWLALIGTSIEIVRNRAIAEEAERTLRKFGHGQV